MEYLSSQKNSQLVLEIRKRFGEMEMAEVLEKLRLCKEFFPAFHGLVTELQEFLG